MSNIHVYYIRHGYSCANYIQEKTKFLHKFVQDPLLTDFGVTCSKQASKEAPEVDLVCSSFLLRAIETAHFMFPKHKIIPIPYINELSAGLDNLPKSIQQQKRLLLKYHGTHSFVSLPSRHPTGYSEGDLKKFKSFLNNYVKTRPELKNKKDVHVAVVTHSNWMMKFLNMIQRPKNNKIVTLENGKIKTLFKGFSIPETVKVQQC